jgi:YgiT-type zinc finger domain-containing protein
MHKVQCNYCAGEVFESRQVPYLYEHEGKYLLVPNMPVEVCAQCGMEYYDGRTLEETERHFYAIHRHEESPDSMLEVPVKKTAAMA